MSGNSVLRASLALMDMRYLPFHISSWHKRYKVTVPLIMAISGRSPTTFGRPSPREPRPLAPHSLRFRRRAVARVMRRDAQSAWPHP